ncbi:7 transmembrane receptor (rhodopsin family) domain-containing protein [Ditylenchus destructor]|uniref:7 transmembrane receptor (Rhodopsin family) domain-containing protein n=1 Tax=Ditylenchus destructor TaxID=166010 RepID=A0AAD4NJJ6_9BILA|nr:7 transmembrane receptor (rhodopsin family) domain-containing protein [Ditylenchus destructor]
MENATSSSYYQEYSNEALPMEEECYYIGTDFLEVKIYLIGVFAAVLAVTSLFFNAFFTCVFILNVSLRRSPLYYFGILAVLDTIMAINYLALMAVPVYMDQFQWLWLYITFLAYLRPMMTLSNCAMFASVLLILAATVERLLRTFRSENLASLRKFMERRRPQVCLVLIGVALAYKMCTYFEIHYIEHENCTDWSRYEIVPTELALNPNYRFWWMFVARNIIDRIIPFFVLVLMNFLIIRTLKREHLRSSKAGMEIVAFKTIDSNRRMLKRTFSLNNGPEDQSNKKNLRDATRALTAIVTMYLLSQTLQVLTTFAEAFWKFELENDYAQFYSYLNDLMSVLTLTSSALRFPVYCAISKPISTASRETLLQFYNHTIKPVKNPRGNSKKKTSTREVNVKPKERPKLGMGSSKRKANGMYESPKVEANGAGPQVPRLVRLATPEEILPLTQQTPSVADQFTYQEQRILQGYKDNIPWK